MSAWITNHWIELFGAVSGLLYVFLEIRQKILLWPVGLVSSAVYIIVFYNSKFYADMGLQVYYVSISIYGWYWWLHGREVAESGYLPVIKTPVKLYSILLVVFTILFGSVWYLLFRFTDSPIPGWDSLSTSISIIATWMLARKYLEHWILWMVANSISTGLYIFKELYPTVILFIIYTVMAFVGYINWKREYDKSLLKLIDSNG